MWHIKIMLITQMCLRLITIICHSKNICNAKNVTSYEVAAEMSTSAISCDLNGHFITMSRVFGGTVRDHLRETRLCARCTHRGFGLTAVCHGNWRASKRTPSVVNIVKRVLYDGCKGLIWTGISCTQQSWLNFIEGTDGILRVIVMPFIHNHFMLQHNNAKPYATRICTHSMQMVVIPDTDSPAPFMWETKGTPVRWSNTDFLSKREKLYFYFDALRFLSLMFCFHDSVCDDSKLLINLAVLNDSEWILILIRTLYMSDMTALEMLPVDSKPSYMKAKRRFKTS